MPYIVPTNETPTFWNKDAGLGALIGTFVGAIPGTLIGGAIGGYLGKSRMETELRSGKVVKEPGFWNKDAAIGCMLGILAGGLAAAAAILIGGLVTFGAVSLMPLAIAYTASLLLPLAGGAIGLMKGGNAGKARMEQEYAAAQEYERTYTPSRSEAPGRTREPVQEYDNPAPHVPFTEQYKQKIAQPAFVTGQNR